jgi:hypothetical protein
MGVMSANGTWLLCFGTQDIVGGVTEARFSSASRRSVDRYLSALTDVSRVPGLTGKEFRRVLLQTEVVVRLFIGTQNRLVALHSALFPRLT